MMEYSENCKIIFERIVRLFELESQILENLRLMPTYRTGRRTITYNGSKIIAEIDDTFISLNGERIFTPDDLFSLIIEGRKMPEIFEILGEGLSDLILPIITESGIDVDKIERVEYYYEGVETIIRRFHSGYSNIRMTYTHPKRKEFIAELMDFEICFERWRRDLDDYEDHIMNIMPRRLLKVLNPSRYMLKIYERVIDALDQIITDDEKLLKMIKEVIAFLELAGIDLRRRW